MTPVIRIDDEVMAELKKRAVEFGLVFEPPNATLRKLFGIDSKGHSSEPAENIAATISPQTATATEIAHESKAPNENIHLENAIKDMVTGRVYATKESVGQGFKHKFPNMAAEFIWYAMIRKYPGRFMELPTGEIY
jgi:hypothetical protein